MNKYNPKIHHRKSIRLKGHDYSQAGLYFITICCQNRACLYGDIVNGKMVLNNAGVMINQLWDEIPNDFKNIKLYEMIIMPNHIHGIIEIVGADSISALNTQNSTQNDGVNMVNRADIESAPTPYIPMVVQSFKRHTMIKYIKMVKNGILPPFDKKIWQRNYWEHIIRNENEYQLIAQYIIDNPSKWGLDKLNGGSGNVVMETQLEYNSEIWMV